MKKLAALTFAAPLGMAMYNLLMDAFMSSVDAPFHHLLADVANTIANFSF